MFTNLTYLFFNEFSISTCIFIIDNDLLKKSKALKYLYIQKMIFIASLVLLLIVQFNAHVHYLKSRHSQYYGITFRLGRYFNTKTAKTMYYA